MGVADRPARPGPGHIHVLSEICYELVPTRIQAKLQAHEQYLTKARGTWMSVRSRPARPGHAL